MLAIDYYWFCLVTPCWFLDSWVSFFCCLLCDAWPPSLSEVRHIITLADSEWEKSYHSDFKNGVVEEILGPGGGGVPYESGNLNPVLWTPTCLYIIIHIPGAGTD